MEWCHWSCFAEISGNGSGAEGAEVGAAVAGSVEPQPGRCAHAAARLSRHGGHAHPCRQVWIQGCPHLPERALHRLLCGNSFLTITSYTSLVSRVFRFSLVTLIYLQMFFGPWDSLTKTITHLKLTLANAAVSAT